MRVMCSVGQRSLLYSSLLLCAVYGAERYRDHVLGVLDWSHARRTENVAAERFGEIGCVVRCRSSAAYIV
uniref:Putative secreted protein n=1 Tax=Anopheles triannulatus TaxID=58253 RepID=A0A2M4B7W4_9DIPT